MSARRPDSDKNVFDLNLPKAPASSTNFSVLPKWITLDEVKHGEDPSSDYSPAEIDPDEIRLVMPYEHGNSSAIVTIGTTLPDKRVDTRIHGGYKGFISFLQKSVSTPLSEVAVSFDPNEVPETAYINPKTVNAFQFIEASLRMFKDWRLWRYRKHRKTLVYLGPNKILPLDNKGECGELDFIVAIVGKDLADCFLCENTHDTDAVPSSNGSRLYFNVSRLAAQSEARKKISLPMQIYAFMAHHRPQYDTLFSFQDGQRILSPVSPAKWRKAIREFQNLPAPV
jgi:hypothetical protein